MTIDITAVLTHSQTVGASDIRLKCSEPPNFRVHGQWAPQTQFSPVTPKDVVHAVTELSSAFDKTATTDALRSVKDAGFSCVCDTLLFRGQFGWELDRPFLILRPITEVVPRLGDLRLLPRHLLDETHSFDPQARLAELAGLRQGLVLVTGATGSGKSTTLAGIIAEINHTAAKHILTVEDPVEFRHRPVQSTFTQREVGPNGDTPTFASGLKAALRSAPDVILVGEMRDRDTMRAALEAAETGHVVFGTLHTNNAIATLNRIIQLFPGDEAQNVRGLLANLLRAVVSQQLVPRADGQGRQLITELMRVDTSVRAELNADGALGEESIRSSLNAFKTGSVSMDRELAAACAMAVITPETAEAAAHYPENFKAVLAQAQTSSRHQRQLQAQLAQGAVAR